MHGTGSAQGAAWLESIAAHRVAARKIVFIFYSPTISVVELLPEHLRHARARLQPAQANLHLLHVGEGVFDARERQAAGLHARLDRLGADGGEVRGQRRSVPDHDNVGPRLERPQDRLVIAQGAPLTPKSRS